MNRPRPWETAEELAVSCWCGHRMRDFTRNQIRTGTAGWSCGKPGCTKETR